MYTQKQNNNKNIYQTNNIVSDDEYINKHVACIVVGNKEFYEKYQQTAKKQNKDLDQLVGTDFLFGKYLNFETNEKEWQDQLDDLRKQLSNNNPKFANLKGIKFVLDEHGVEGNNRFLAANTQYYKSKRFQQVAQIINANFLNKNKDNKLYFTNRACYGTYNFNERNKKHDSDTHNNNNGFYSNNLYNILLTTLGNNARKVYCSQLKPEIGINRTGSINPNSNPFRNAVSLAQSILIEPSAIPNFLVNKDKEKDTDLIRQYWYEGIRNFDPKIIESPYCKIYFPLTQYRDVVPDALCLKPNGPKKEYRVDSKIFENYTGLQGKTAKNEFLGRQYLTKANIYHNDTEAKNIMSTVTKEIIHRHNQELTKRRKEQEAQAKKEYIKAQWEHRQNSISSKEANHYMAYPCQYCPYNMFS